MKWRNAKILHWRYYINNADIQFENAVNTIKYVKQKRQIEDSNKAFNILVAANWNPSTA